MSFITLTPPYVPATVITDENPSANAKIPSSDNASLEKSPLKNRVCLNWRIIPGIVALAASIVAIVYSLILRHPALCAVFAPGGACSVYLIYLGYHFQNLQSFSENNRQLESSVSLLKSENQQLQTSIGGLNASLSDLSAENNTLKSSNIQLATTTNSLKAQINDLEGIKKTLEENAKLNGTQLDVFKESIAEMQRAAATDHTTFASNLETFVQQIEKLETTQASQCTTLLTSARLLEQLFGEIKDWKNAKEVEARLTTQQNLQKQIVELQGQIGLNTGLLQAYKEQVVEQKEQIAQLAEIKKGFDGLLPKLIDVTTNLQTYNGDIKEEIEILTNMIKKNYGFGN